MNDNLVPRNLTNEQKINRLRKALKNGQDFRKLPIFRADMFQVLVNGTAEQKSKVDALIARAERRFGK